MNKPLAATPPVGHDIDLGSLTWMLLKGGDEFDYRIDYAYAVAKADPAAGKIELLVRWEPKSYCHYHRHLGRQIATILEGEQHIYEKRPFETIHKVRRVGFSGEVPDGDVHMEHAGDDGLTILFHIDAPDGRIFDILDDDGNILQTTSIADFVDRKLGEPA